MEKLREMNLYSSQPIEIRINGEINFINIFLFNSFLWVNKRYDAGTKDNKKILFVKMESIRNRPDKKYFLLLKKYRPVSEKKIAGISPKI
jgi:hypothetical protein